MDSQFISSDGSASRSLSLNGDKALFPSPWPLLSNRGSLLRYFVQSGVSHITKLSDPGY